MQNGLIYCGNKKEIIKRNLLAGIARGVGIGIGVTIITAILVMLLQKIVTLNIPVIGEYIADIVEIVEKSRQIIKCVKTTIEIKMFSLTNFQQIDKIYSDFGKWRKK